MLRILGMCLRVGLYAALATVAGAGCLCPPCAGEAQSPTGEVVASGSRHVIWDGDGAGTGAQGWADCDKKPDCKATAAVARKRGREKSTALKFHSEGTGWGGMGWNWFGWWPKDAGVDISPYDNLTFWLKVVVKSPDLAPEPDAFVVGLRCSAGEKNSASVQLTKAKRNFLDGEWHKIVMPLKEFYRGKEGKEFDPHSAWELNFSAWSPSHRDYDAYIDEIAVEKD